MYIDKKEKTDMVSIVQAHAYPCHALLPLALGRCLYVGWHSSPRMDAVMCWPFLFPGFAVCSPCLSCPGRARGVGLGLRVSS